MRYIKYEDETEKLTPEQQDALTEAQDQRMCYAIMCYLMHKGARRGFWRPQGDYAQYSLFSMIDQICPERVEVTTPEMLQAEADLKQMRATAIEEA